MATLDRFLLFTTVRFWPESDLPGNACFPFQISEQFWSVSAKSGPSFR